jgi:hypothetical protein
VTGADLLGDMVVSDRYCPLITEANGTDCAHGLRRAVPQIFRILVCDGVPSPCGGNVVLPTAMLRGPGVLVSSPTTSSPRFRGVSPSILDAKDLGGTA